MTRASRPAHSSTPDLGCPRQIGNGSWLPSGPPNSWTRHLDEAKAAAILLPNLPAGLEGCIGGLEGKVMTDSRAMWGNGTMVRALAIGAGALLALAAASLPAKADLKMCNNTASRVGVAIGYKDKEGWASEGWWTIDSQKCLVPAQGRADCPLLLRLCRRLREGRLVGRQGDDVHPRQDLHHPRPR